MEELLSFSEVEIAELFGHEAAESEEPARLRQYYFKNRVFEQVTAPLPLRLLVGHKGIGKSALFQVAMQEDRDNRIFPLEIRPDDVSAISTDDADFLKKIAAWKDGLHRIIAEKAIASFPVDVVDRKPILQKGRALIQSIAEVLAPLAEGRANLDSAKRAILKQFFENKRIIVYMDDLDRGWEGQRNDIVRISALLNAVRDISRDDPGVQFRVALRSDVYFLVRTSDESTDKLGGSVVWYKWTNHEILALLVKRIEAYFGRNHSEGGLLIMDQRDLASYLKPVLVERFMGDGKWSDIPIYKVIMSLIRRRPRDLVKLLTLAGRHAHNDQSRRIETRHLRDSFEEYSQDRLQDTTNEYRSEFPDIRRLLFGMKPNRRERQTRAEFLYSTSALMQKIKDISESGAFKDTTGRALSPKELASFMYKINFLIASKQQSDGYIDRKYFEENRYISPEFADFGYDWEVHPAYRWALQPDDRNAIFNNLGLSADEKQS